MIPLLSWKCSASIRLNVMGERRKRHFYLIATLLRVNSTSLCNKVIWETGNVGLHWPGSCRCTPNRPAAARCNCIPCPDSWCCCSSVGSASSRSSANGTTERCTQTIHTSLCSDTLTASLVFAPAPGRWQRLCRQAAAAHRFISAWAWTAPRCYVPPVREEWKLLL